MLLAELFAPTKEEQQLYEDAKIAWGRVGNHVVRKYRCTDGPRQGRLVSHPAKCHKPVDIKKRIRFRQTKLAKGLRLQRRRAITMRQKPASIRIQTMNKMIDGK